MKSQRTAIHICNSHEPPLNQKLQKSMSLPTRRVNETCSKFKRENERNERKPVHNKDYKSLGSRWLY